MTKHDKYKHVDDAFLEQVMTSDASEEEKDVMAYMVDHEVTDIDEEVRDDYMQNLVTYAYVQRTKSVSMDAYLKAVKFITIKRFCNNATEAFRETFPERIAKYAAMGKTSNKYIASRASGYNRSQLVVTIEEQSATALWITKQDQAHAMLDVLYGIAKDGESEFVRMQAADKFLSHVKIPEAIKAEVNITTELNPLAEMQRATAELADAQAKAIETGIFNVFDHASAKNVVVRKLPSPVVIDGEGEIVNE